MRSSLNRFMVTFWVIAAAWSHQGEAGYELRALEYAGKEYKFLYDSQRPGEYSRVITEFEFWRDNKGKPLIHSFESDDFIVLKFLWTTRDYGTPDQILSQLRNLSSGARQVRLKNGVIRDVVLDPLWAALAGIEVIEVPIGEIAFRNSVLELVVRIPRDRLHTLVQLSRQQEGGGFFVEQSIPAIQSSDPEGIIIPGILNWPELELCQLDPMLTCHSSQEG